MHTQVFASSASRKRTRDGVSASQSMSNAAASRHPPSKAQRVTITASGVDAPSSVIDTSSQHTSVGVDKDQDGAITISWSEFDATCLHPAETPSSLYRESIMMGQSSRIGGIEQGFAFTQGNVEAIGSMNDGNYGAPSPQLMLCCAVRRTILAVESAVVSSLNIGLDSDSNSSDSGAVKMSHSILLSCLQCGVVVGVLDRLSARRESSGPQHMPVCEAQVVRNDVVGRGAQSVVSSAAESSAGICWRCAAATGSANAHNSLRVSVLMRSAPLLCAEGAARVSDKKLDLVSYEIGVNVDIVSFDASSGGAIEPQVRMSVHEIETALHPSEVSCPQDVAVSGTTGAEREGGDSVNAYAANVRTSSVPPLHIGDVALDRSSSVVRLNSQSAVR